MKKDKKPDTLAVIDNYNLYDRHTDTQTDGHGNSLTNPAQRADSVKMHNPLLSHFVRSSICPCT